MTSRTTNSTGATLAGALAFGILSSAFATDPELENNGAWMPVAEGVRLKVRSQQAEQSREVARQINDEYSSFVAGRYTPAQQDAQDLEMAARALVTDWEGVTEGGEKLACTEANVRRVLTELPHLRRAVERFSLSLANYKVKQDQK